MAEVQPAKFPRLAAGLVYPKSALETERKLQRREEKAALWFSVFCLDLLLTGRQIEAVEQRKNCFLQWVWEISTKGP